MKYNNAMIGERLRELRKNKNWSQDKLIEWLSYKNVKIGRNTLSNIENGEIEKASIEFFLVLAELYECEVGYLLCEKGYEESKTRAIADMQKETGLSVEAVGRIKHLSQNEMYFLSNLLTVNYGKNFRTLSEHYYHIQNDIKLIKAIENGLIQDTFGDNFAEAVSDKKFRKFWLTDEISMFSENEALKDIMYFADKE